MLIRTRSSSRSTTAHRNRIRRRATLFAAARLPRPTPAIRLPRSSTKRKWCSTTSPAGTTCSTRTPRVENGRDREFSRRWSKPRHATSAPASAATGVIQHAQADIDDAESPQWTCATDDRASMRRLRRSSRVRSILPRSSTSQLESMAHTALCGRNRSDDEPSNPPSCASLRASRDRCTTTWIRATPVLIIEDESLCRQRRPPVRRENIGNCFPACVAAEPP